MKKLLAVMLLLSLILVSFASCTKKTDDDRDADDHDTAGQTETDTDNEKTDGETEKEDEKASLTQKEKDRAAAAAECYQNVIHAKNAEELAKYTCVGNAEDYFANVENAYGNGTYSVKAENAGKFKDYEVYYLTVTEKNEPENKRSCFEFFEEKDGEIRLVLSADIVNEAVSSCACATCGGSGGTMIGQVVCGICGGTGVQTIPNAYFDPTLNMWMPQTVGCGGCGGSGHTSEGTFTPCAPCLGRGYIFG